MRLTEQEGKQFDSLCAKVKRLEGELETEAAAHAKTRDALERFQWALIYLPEDRFVDGLDACQLRTYLRDFRRELSVGPVDTQEEGSWAVEEPPREPKVDNEASTPEADEWTGKDGDGQPVDLRACPKCRKPRVNYLLKDMTGKVADNMGKLRVAHAIAGKCCNPKCGARWGTGCWHCHSPRFSSAEALRGDPAPVDGEGGE